MGLVEILHDRERLEQHRPVAVDQRRQHHLRIDLAERVLALLALDQVDVDDLVRHDTFEIERDPHPERRERAPERKQLHGLSPCEIVMVWFLSYYTGAQATLRRHRPRKRAIQYSRTDRCGMGGSSYNGPRILDARLRGHDSRGALNGRTDMASVEDTRTPGTAGKTHQHRSEVRDGMRIDWDVPIEDGRRPGAARRRLSPGEGRPLSGDPELRSLRQGPRLPGRLSERVAAHGRAASRRHRRLQQSLPELGSGRSGEMGAARLCLRARRFPRLRLLARLHRSFLAARDQGFLRLHRMGRRAAVVERQGRAQRHFLLRHQPVAGGEPAAAASRRHVHLGGRRRLVPRHDPSRRHRLHVLGKLVRHAGEDRAIRRGRARQALARARRARLRAGNAVGGRARRQPQRAGRRHPRPSARRRLPPCALAGLVEGQDAVALGRQLGRPAAASARQFRRLRARGREGQMARGARHRALDPFLHRLWPQAAARASSTISCTARTTASTSSRACCCRCATSTNSWSAPSTNGRSSAPNGPSSTSIPRAARSRASARPQRRRSNSRLWATASPS